jgi:hypothetical protein
MNITLPQYLYKYRCVDANALSLLASDQLYLARVESFDDPFEFLDLNATIKAASTTDPVTAFATLDAERHADKLHGGMRVCALTEECQNLLMWGHYTDCHRGFCIRFDFREESQLSKMLFPVTYQANLPDLTKPPRDAEGIARINCLTKSSEWSYEREWRMIGHVPEATAHTAELFIPYIAKSITGIIFGLRTPQPHKLLIRTVLARHPHIKYFQAYKQHDAFSLAIRQIETDVGNESRSLYH